MKALQFIGTQRSGSNLLRVMLNGHSAISAPHPPHILQVMMPFLPGYGTLEDPKAFKQLLEDVCTLVELNPVNWDIHFDRESIELACENISLPQIMKAVYEAKARAGNATIWSCKSMASIHYAEQIENAGLNPFYIFIYRDGRDVACSFRKAVVGEKHVYNLALQWKDEQEKSIALCNTVGEGRAIRIRYEDFILNPEQDLRRICLALGISYEPQMMNYADSDESKMTASSGKMWGNLVKPVLKYNTRKYLSELSREELIIFESVAGDTLEKLGYYRLIPTDELREFSASDIELFYAKNKKWQHEAKQEAEVDMQKRKAQDDFIQHLRTRLNEKKRIDGEY
jgi:hypothetical protein